jgi:hypothetical protein
MLLSPANSDSIGLIAALLQVLSLYAAQAAILWWVRGDRAASWTYIALVTASIPVCWAFSPHWHSPQSFPIATYLGWPLTIHVVPMWSFHRGQVLRRSGRLGRWWITILIHLLVALPAWFFVWTIAQLFLGFWYI